MQTQTVDSIKIIDAHYVREGIACCYLMIEEDRAAIIETNTNYAVPYILEEMKNSSIKLENVDYVIITHVHLDHAGGAGKLMELFPNAKLLAHPRAARHMIDPSRLIQSSIQVYGEERFRQLYGEILPIEESRVQVIEDGEEITFGSRKLKFLHTKGHANHHFVIYDSKTNGVFSGDSFGLAYPALQEKGLFIVPTTTPTDFDPQEAYLSIDKILETKCDKVFLTHYGMIQDLENAKNQLKEGLKFSEELLDWCVKSNKSQEEQHQQVKNELMEYFRTKLKQLGMMETEERRFLFEMDAELNAMGIVYAAQRKKKT
ncbi:MAG: MBL fold metallo-hydrolase [Leptospiraceae bacterium]|nr:MBL fold metallo-hydrolase [Leptospiraceae bacterium]MDW7975921.1 MBL fold metallo-hydrolase [Leptospiraceae bacterium]